MKKTILQFSLAFALIFAFTGCDKIQEELISELETSETMAQAESALEDAGDQASLKMIDPSSGDFASTGSGDCPTVTFSAEVGTFPNTMTIDYGDGCECGPGHTKSGKIIVEMSADIMETGASKVISVEDFFVNDVQVTGTRSVANTGITEDGFPLFSVTVSEGGLILPDGRTSSLEVRHSRLMTAGFDTEEKEDDVFEITGEEWGTGPNGNSFTGTILEPLVKSMDCRFITSGIHEIVTEEKTRSIDFGDGTCDDLATITRDDGTTKTIHLRRRKGRR